MWSVIVTATGEVFATNFETLQAANQWHDEWCDQFVDDDLRPGVTFAKS